MADFNSHMLWAHLQIEKKNQERIKVVNNMVNVYKNHISEEILQIRGENDFKFEISMMSGIHYP